jgi:hypothetical protein
MSTTKYIRPMGFIELIRSALKIYIRTIWPLWILVLLTYLGLDFAFLKLSPIAGQNLITLLLVIFILLPVFFIGPSMLTISNVILERPQKVLANFRKGMSFGMLLKTALYFFHILAAIVILSIYGLVQDYYSYVFMIFTVPLLFFAPVWVFYPMILLLEKKSILKSIRRTMIFISRQIKRLFQIQILLTFLTGLLLPLGIIYYQTLYGLAPISYSLEYWKEYPHRTTDRIAGGLYYSVPFVLGLGIILYVLHYYQVRAEKENFSEELLAQELGYQPMEEMMNV